MLKHDDFPEGVRPFRIEPPTLRDFTPTDMDPLYDPEADLAFSMAVWTSRLQYACLTTHGQVWENTPHENEEPNPPLFF